MIRTSEQVVGLAPQPAPLCPLVDLGIELLDSDDRDAQLKLFEVLRDHIVKLRMWGQEWKSQAIECMSEAPTYTEEMREIREKGLGYD